VIAAHARGAAYGAGRSVRARTPPRQLDAMGFTGLEKADNSPLPQDPTACLVVPTRTPTGSHRPRAAVLGRARRRAGLTGQCSTLEHHSGTNVRTGSGPAAVRAPRARQALLRKEVIQPHLPVRLPCYDFVPIADPTFDGSLHEGWATGFGCYRLS